MNSEKSGEHVLLVYFRFPSLLLYPIALPRRSATAFGMHLGARPKQEQCFPLSREAPEAFAAGNSLFVPFDKDLEANRLTRASACHWRSFCVSGDL